MTGSYAGLGLASYTEPGLTKAQIMDAMGMESFEILAESSSSSCSDSSIECSEPEPDEVPAYDEGFFYLEFPNLTVP